MFVPVFLNMTIAGKIYVGNDSLKTSSKKFSDNAKQQNNSLGMLERNPKTKNSKTDLVNIYSIYFKH